MPKEKKNIYENLLPKDEELIQRSIIWGTVFEKYSKIDEKEDLTFDFNDEENDGDNKSKSTESIDPLEYEVNENENDSGFDVQDTFNKTIKYVEKRKKQWHNNGMDQLMDSFNLNIIQNKVGNWLASETNLFNNNLASSINNIPMPNSFINEEVNIQNHEFYTDDSVNSVDTAKYILANRKRSKSKITTMTIKRYRYSNLNKINEHNNEQQYRKFTGDRVLEDYNRRRISSLENYPITNNSINNDKYPNKKSKRKSNKPIKNYKQNKSRDDTSSSKSSSLSPTKDERLDIGCKLFSEYDYKFKNSLSPRKNNRKISRKSTKWRNILHSKENNKNTSSSSSTVTTITPSPRKKTSKKQQIKKKSYKLHKTDNDDYADYNKSVQSDINFNSNNFINSTAIDKQQFACKKLLKNVDNVSESINNNGTNDSNSSVVLYEPSDRINNSKNLTIRQGKIILSKKLLIDKIGKNLTEHFLNGENEIMHKFDSSSKIIFYPPKSDDNNESDSTEIDFLESAFKEKGRIVEIVDLI